MIEANNKQTRGKEKKKQLGLDQMDGASLE
jgi:hypothetical protein